MRSSTDRHCEAWHATSSPVLVPQYCLPELDHVTGLTPTQVFPPQQFLGMSVLAFQAYYEN